MGIGNFIARNAEKAIFAGGRGVTNLSHSRLGMGALGVGALALGVGSVVGPAARDAALDFSMGDKDADVAFTGSKFSARYLAGTAMGGGLGSVLRASSPSDYFRENPMIAGSKGAYTGVATTVGAGLGAGVGGFIGSKIGQKVLPGKLGSIGGALVGGAVGAATGALPGELFAASSGLIGVGNTSLGIAGSVGGLVGGGILGRMAGTAAQKAGIPLIGPKMGAMIGGAIGAGLGAGGFNAFSGGGIRGYVDNNQQFFKESPYAPRSSSLATASSLSASGDIVLGMHNSRRGY